MSAVFTIDQAIPLAASFTVCEILHLLSLAFVLSTLLTVSEQQHRALYHLKSTAQRHLHCSL